MPSTGPCQAGSSGHCPGRTAAPRPAWAWCPRLLGPQLWGDRCSSGPASDITHRDLRAVRGSQPAGASDNSSGQGLRGPEFWLGEGDSVIRCPDARETQSRRKWRPNRPHARRALEQHWQGCFLLWARRLAVRQKREDVVRREGAAGGSWQPRASRSLTQTVQNGGS